MEHRVLQTLVAWYIRWVNFWEKILSGKKRAQNINEVIKLSTIEKWTIEKRQRRNDIGSTSIETDEHRNVLAVYMPTFIIQTERPINNQIMYALCNNNNLQTDTMNQLMETRISIFRLSTHYTHSIYGRYTVAVAIFHAAIA